VVFASNQLPNADPPSITQGSISALTANDQPDLLSVDRVFGAVLLPDYSAVLPDINVGPDMRWSGIAEPEMPTPADLYLPYPLMGLA
jgi:hypothetical protein